MTAEQDIEADGFGLAASNKDVEAVLDSDVAEKGNEKGKKGHGVTFADADNVEDDVTPSAPSADEDLMDCNEVSSDMGLDKCPQLMELNEANVSKAVGRWESKKTPRWDQSMTSQSSVFRGNIRVQSETGFVGLSNQGATCYMNSLLQTMYMTPEFRRTVYEWDYNLAKDGPMDECIPYQLQSLFATLQLTERAYAETKSLTTSFGWLDREVFQQHDVQELNRILMDALEDAFKETKCDGKIENLYRGRLEDYITCRECGHSRSRMDEFYDLSLQVRGIQSVEESIRMYVKSELLDGDNQYMCEKCDKKVDADKGLRLQELPYCLTLQLKRFDFDYNTFERIKLNEEVSFPDFLDMSEFLEKDEAEAGEGGDEETSGVKGKEDADDTLFEMDGEEETSKTTDGGAQHTSESKDVPTTEEVAPAAAPDEESGDGVVLTGDHIYELFSILIHSGGAGGGHYYAYVKDMDSKKWYEFNDSIVRDLNAGEIEKTFGGFSPQYNLISTSPVAHITRSANAYMLMYRKVDENNETFPSNESISRTLADDISADNEVYRKQLAEEEERLNKINVTIMYETMEVSVTLNKSRTFTQSTEDVYNKELLGIKEKHQLDCIRLRNAAGCVDYTGNEDKPLSYLGVDSYTTLVVETKRPDEEWRSCDPDDLLLQLCEWDDAQKMTRHPVPIFFPGTWTLTHLRDIVHSLMDIPPSEQLLVDMRHPLLMNGEPDDIVKDKYSLLDGTRICVERRNLSQQPEEEAEGSVPFSNAVEEFERRKYMISVYFNSLQDQARHTNTIVVDNRITLKELRHAIAEQLHEDPDDLRLKRSTIYFKRDDETLTDLKISNGACISLEKGAPLTPDQFKVWTYTYDVATLQAMTSMIVKEGLKTSEFRDLVLQELKLSPEHADLTLKRLRFRGMYARKVTTVYDENKTLGQNLGGTGHIYDGKEIAVQILEEEEEHFDIQNNTILLLQQWLPEQNSLGDPFELVIGKGATRAEVRAILADKTSIVPENIRFAKPFPSFSLSAYQVAFMDFRGTTDEEEEDKAILHTRPWVLTESDKLLFTDIKAKEEAAAVAKQTDTDTNGDGSGLTSPTSLSRTSSDALPRMDEEIATVPTATNVSLSDRFRAADNVAATSNNALVLCPEPATTTAAPKPVRRVEQGLKIKTRRNGNKLAPDGERKTEE